MTVVMWASVADAWARNADYADARGAEVTERMLAATAPRPGDRVLELACGAGGAGLAAAPLVTPGGEVVLSDAVPHLVDVAVARAAERGLVGVRGETLDLDNLAAPDEAYDVVLCREGLMFARDHARSAGDLRRVLRRGGRFAVAVWGPRERNPWLGLVFDAVGAQLGMPMPPPGVNGPFALGDTDRLRDLFVDAGLSVEVAEVPAPLRAPTFDAWFTRTTALAGPLAGRMAALDEPARRNLRERLIAAVHPFQTPDGLDFPGVSLLATGLRA